jgi:hypothetical protein
MAVVALGEMDPTVAMLVEADLIDTDPDNDNPTER